jgi:hypothetical protein
VLLPSFAARLSRNSQVLGVLPRQEMLHLGQLHGGWYSALLYLSFHTLMFTYFFDVARAPGEGMYGGGAHSPQTRPAVSAWRLRCAGEIKIRTTLVFFLVWHIYTRFSSPSSPETMDHTMYRKNWNPLRITTQNAASKRVAQQGQATP